MRLLVWAVLTAGLWAKGPGVTFSHDVAPILYRHCASCHHAGAGAPFPLVTYADTAAKAGLIAAVTGKRYMPPWPAAGAPQGNPAEMPPAPQFTEGWSGGKPDLEAEMPHAFHVPADGPDM